MTMRSSRWRVRLLLACAASALFGVVTIAGAADHASESDAGATSEVLDAGSDGDTAHAGDPEVARLEQTSALVRSLASGGLEGGVDVDALFDIPLTDDQAVGLEAARLSLLLRADAARPAKSTEHPRVAHASRFDAAMANAPDPETISPVLLAARLALDRARLEFYVLPASRRHELLALASRVDASAPSQDDPRAIEAERKRRAALATAHDARSEAERLVATEYARLLAVEGAQAKLDDSLTAQREEIAARRETTLLWERRAREARGQAPGSDSVDRTYDDLRRALRGARNDLSTALDALSPGATDVPQAGPDALSDLQIDVDTTDARKERDRVDADARRLGEDESSLRQQRASQLLDEIDTLNRERLALLDFLSPAKRAAITGFTAAGFDQAESEVRQLTLILRDHRHVAGGWVTSLRHPSRALGRALAGSVAGVLEWLAVIVAFLWWRRRADAVLAVLQRRARYADKDARRTHPGMPRRVVGFLREVHGPVEWLALLVVLTWLLPDEVKTVLEVRVLSAVVEWTFGAGFIVNAINALASTELDGAVTHAPLDAAGLRLRSLRLVGRTIVAFGLVLVISSMVVGHGTIYEWVFSTCWLASIPIFLILIRWWRDVVFRRTDRVRKKSPFQLWVLANKQGWSSFLAATAGGVHLFATGTARAARGWVGRFDVTRRFLAYLFRRELTKLGSERALLASAPLPEKAFASLGPETVSVEWVPTDLDESLARLCTRLADQRGGVVALIGERGLGKTSALRRIAEKAEGTLLLDTPTTGPAALRGSLAERLSLRGDPTLEATAEAIDASPTIRALLLDDVHRFVHPTVGGLAAFDELLAVASRHSRETTWLFALDDIVWQFLERSRGARPLFDDVIRITPWREGEIVSLLSRRTEQAKLAPSFENILDRLPTNADEVDKQEALARRAADYHRLLWDYAYGNPSVALHMWRRSLGVDADGGVYVRLFREMDTSDLERLPDRAVFVLRAVLQMAPARPEEIARATMLRPPDVADALRYAAARGYVEEHGDGYRVTWTWFRAMTLFLQRRHLMVPR
jgi:hypothetical protein